MPAAGTASDQPSPVESRADLSRALERYATPEPAPGIVAQIMGNVVGSQIAIGANITQTRYENHYTLHLNSEQGDLMSPGIVPKPNLRTMPVTPQVRPFHDLLDRQTERDAVRQVLATGGALELHGESGVGKTALLRRLAFEPLATQIPDGIVYSGRLVQQNLPDILHYLFTCFYEAEAVLIKPRDAEVQQLLRDRRALIILDDLELQREDAGALLDAMPRSVFLLATSGRLFPGEARGLPMYGLPPPDAVRLFEQHRERALTETERATVLRLCQQLQGHPLRIIQAAELARKDDRPLAAWLTGFQNTDADNPQILTTLDNCSDDEKRLLAALASCGGLVLNAEALAGIANVPNASATIRPLIEMELVEAQDAGYQIKSNTNEVLGRVWNLAPWQAQATIYFINWAEQRVRQPKEIASELEPILWLLQEAERAGKSEDVLRLGRAVEGALTITGRWGAWNQTLHMELRAARELQNQPAEAWAWHQLGTRAIAMEENDAAYEALTKALEIRERLGDEAGAAATRYHLNWRFPHLLPPPGNSTTSHAGTKLMSRLKGLLLAGGALVLLGALVYTVWPISEGKLTPRDLSFAAQAVGGESEPQIASFTNDGKSPLAIGWVIVAGVGAPHFKLSPGQCSNQKLQPGGNCAIQVLFAPKEAGSHQARLTISDAGGKSLGEASLTGAGKPPTPTPTIPPTPVPSTPSPAPLPPSMPAASVNPTSLNFALQILGSAGDVKPLQITNSGTAPLLIQSLTVSGLHSRDFALIENKCLRPIAPRASCNASVRFTAQAAGERSADLRITANVTNVAMIVPLRGSAEAPKQPAISLEPDSWEFSAPASINDRSELSNQQRSISSRPATALASRPLPVSDKIFYLANAGQAPLSINRISSTDGATFPIRKNSCLQTLLPGQRCEITASFAARRAGSYSGQIVIISNAPGNPHAISLSGAVTAAPPPPPPRIRATPNPLNFGQGLVEREESINKSLNLQNTGSVPVRIAELAVNNAKRNEANFFIQSDTCRTRPLQPNESCTVRFVFSPYKIGNWQAELKAVGENGVELETVALSGTGITRLGIPVSPPLRKPLPLPDNIRLGRPPQEETVRRPPQIVTPVETAPRIRINPDSLNFGTQAIEQKFNLRTITVTNDGAGTISFSRPVIAGDQAGGFAVSSETCTGKPIAPNNSCTISIGFKPQDAAGYRARLVIRASNQRELGSLPLQGVGTGGWCCYRGEAFPTTAEDCKRRKGIYSPSREQAEARCETPVRRSPKR